METVNSDNALTLKSEDKFNRSAFAERIAQTIIDRGNSGCLVIGIYGAWGEGKTTVLNFINGEFKSHEKDINVVRFNPWRVNGEENLIREFYNDVSNVIMKSTEEPAVVVKKKLDFSLFKKKKDPLKKGTEIIWEKIKPFAKLANLVGLGDVLESVGDFYTSSTLEDFKERFGAFLEKNNKKLVVIIDDIDRLDRDEVQSIFRLVKLNADFKNTVYILSFDEIMVSQMIGHKYGGNQESGFEFLEKIIQVPLVLPKASALDLRDYCFELIQAVFNNLQLTLTEAEKKELGSRFSYFLEGIKTPRMAVRYANIMNYSLPILKGQVNTVDLMLIEALKVFYPPYYDMINAYPEFFIGGFYRKEDKQRNVELFKEKLDKCSVQYTEREAIQLKNLLLILFPKTNEAFSTIVYADHTVDTWYLQKRICSPDYFDRYFTYSIRRGDLSDRDFDIFITNISSNTDNIGYLRFTDLIKNVEKDRLILSLRMRENVFEWETGKKLCYYVLMLSSSLERKRTGWAFYSSPYHQAAIFISNVIFTNKGKPDCDGFVGDLVARAPILDFAFEIFRFVVSEAEKNYGGTDIFEKEKKLKMFEQLKTRMMNESNGKPIFIAFQDLSYAFLLIWKDFCGMEPVGHYLRTVLSANPEYSIELLRTFSPMIVSSTQPEPYIGDFNKDYYEALKSVVDISELRNHLESCYGTEELEATATFTASRGGQTDSNMVRQFNHWYQLDTER